MASRSTTEKGRDGCRVPLPWTADGPSYGFGPKLGHLPQPDWFAAYAVSVQEADPDSTLNLYRQALRAPRSPVRRQRSQLGRIGAVGAALRAAWRRTLHRPTSAPSPFRSRRARCC